MVARSMNRRAAWAAADSVAVSLVLGAGARLDAQAGAIRACVGPSGALRVAGSGESCRSNETAITWNTTGPAGPVFGGTTYHSCWDQVTNTSCP